MQADVRHTEYKAYPSNQSNLVEVLSNQVCPKLWEGQYLKIEYCLDLSHEIFDDMSASTGEFKLQVQIEVKIEGVCWIALAENLNILYYELC